MNWMSDELNMLEIYVTGRCMRDHIGVMIFFVERMATSVSYEFLYGMKRVQILQMFLFFMLMWAWIFADSD